MIKEKELREMRPRTKMKGGSSITLEVVQSVIEECANREGVPVAFYDDQIKFGGLIGGSVNKCIVLFHPEHKDDYFKFAIQVTHQGNYAFLSVNDFGSSKMMGNQGSKDALKEIMASGSGSEKVGVLIGAGIRRLLKGGVNKSKLEAETDWYTIIEDILNEVSSVD